MVLRMDVLLYSMKNDSFSEENKSMHFVHVQIHWDFLLEMYTRMMTRMGIDRKHDD
ncbi:unnamed protein product [Schistosoma curassoni]|uniref:Uncharacterized protein n=1 Tax=Schistosoma curassoni TaxID=6186 RepID=A0A183K8L0_9TREM|nr:unnamed protein product [Schistosoma curassoni]